MMTILIITTALLIISSDFWSRFIKVGQLDQILEEVIEVE